MSEQPQASRSTSTSGQMTQVMRAAGSSSQRVLRLGLMRDGRVVEERVLRTRERVLIGSNEHNLFVLSGAMVPAEFCLFDVEGGHYVLQFTRAMSGKVAWSDGLLELSELREQAQLQGDVYRFELPDDIRGKVVLGDASFLFQFVAPPPAQPKPQLPVSVTRGAIGIDWTTTMIAAFSFLAHFMAIGAIYSDWLDPVVDYDVNLSNLVETFKSLPPPPEVEEKNVEEKDKQEKKEEEVAKAEEKKPVVKDTPKDPANKPRMSQAEAAALAEQLDSFDMGILGVNVGKTATSDVLSSSDSISTSIMDQAAASGAGVSASGPGGLKLTSGGGAIGQGETGGLNTIGAAGKSVESSSGKAAAVKGPTSSASVGGATVAVGQVSDASRVVARLRAQFRQCHQRGLEANPDSAGRVQLKIRVGAGGEVTGVTASASGSLSSSVVDCVKNSARSARFAPPEGGAAVVEVPVTFVKQ